MPDMLVKLLSVMISHRKNLTRLSEVLPGPKKPSRKQDQVKVLYSSITTIDATPSAYRSISALTINYCQLKSLEGVEQFVLLQTLQAKYNYIQSIAPLIHNRGLRRLNLLGNKVCRDKSTYLQGINALGLSLTEINGADSTQFKSIYSQSGSGFGSPRDTEQQVHHPQSQDHNGYGSVDDIDTQLQNCAIWFNKYSILSRAFVSLKHNNSQIGLENRSQKAVKSAVEVSPVNRGNLILLDIDLINKQYIDM